MNTLDSATPELERETRQSKKKTKSVSSKESNKSDRSKRRTHIKSERDDDTESRRSSSRKEREERKIRREREQAIEYLLAVAEAPSLESSLALRASVAATGTSGDALPTRTRAEESYQPDATPQSEQKSSRRKKQMSEGAKKMTEAFWSSPSVVEPKISRREKQVSDGGMRTGQSFWLSTMSHSEKRSSRKQKQVSEGAMRIEDQYHSWLKKTHVSELKPSRTKKQLSDFDVLQQMLDSQRDLTVATEETGSTSHSRDPQRRSRDVRVYRLDATERVEGRIEENYDNHLHLHRPIGSETADDIFDHDFNDELFEEAFDDFNMDHMSLSPWPEAEDKDDNKLGEKGTFDAEFEPVLRSVAMPRLGKPKGANAFTEMNFQVVPRTSTRTVGNVHHAAKKVRSTALSSTRSVPGISTGTSSMSDVRESMQNAASRSESLSCADANLIRRLPLESGYHPHAIVEEFGDDDDRFACLQMDARENEFGSEKMEKPQGDQRWRSRGQGIRGLLSSRPVFFKRKGNDPSL